MMDLKRNLGGLGIAGILLLAQTAAGQGGVFRAAKTFSLGGVPEGATGVVVLADIGSPQGGLDGFIDVVSAGQNQSLPILFGKGDGTFSIGASVTIDVIPTALAVGDLDGDHIPDIVLTDAANSVSVLHGHGDGTFDPTGTKFAAGPQPRAIALADLDGDHKLDAIIADEGSQSGQVTILLGNGDLTFTPTTDSYPSGFAAAALVATDLNGDGKVDVAVANEASGDVFIFRGDGTGALVQVQTIPVGQAPVAIAAGDFNRDGHVDLVVANSDGDSVSVLDGKAGGSFAPARVFPSGSSGSSPRGIAVADVDMDGALDVIVANNFSFDAAVLLGNGTGGFGLPHGYVTDAEPLGVAAADLNGDGAADVVAVNRGRDAPTAAVLLSLGNGRLAGVENLPVDPNPSGLVCGDVDNDGRPDLIVVHSGGGATGSTARVILSALGGGFRDSVLVPLAGDSVAVARGDVNGDGRLDFIELDGAGGSAVVFLGRAAGGFAAPQSVGIGSNASALVVGDWNRDGRSDFAVTRQLSPGSPGEVLVFLAKPTGGFSGPTTLQVGQLPLAIDTGDVNKDGKLDLLVANNSSGNVSILLGNGDGSFQTATSVLVTDTPLGIVVADFDRDGNDDIAVTLGTANAVQVLFGNGQGRFPDSLSRPLAVGATPSAIAARDVTGDGNPDILVTDGVNNTLRVFGRSAANPRGFSTTTDTVQVNRRPIGVVTGDFDDSGTYDAATANSSPAATASVLSNLRSSATLRGDGNGDGTVSAADFVPVVREIADGVNKRADDVASGSVVSNLSVDANGDGWITTQDVRAVTSRIFNRVPRGL